MKRILIETLFIFLLIQAGCSQADDQTKSAYNTGSNFSLAGLKTEKIVLAEALKAEKTILIFWTTWCPHCVREMTEVEKLYRENKGKVSIIGVNVGESRAKVDSFIKKTGVSYPIALDSDSEVAGSYKVRGVPTFITLNQDGKIIYYGYTLKDMVKQVGF